MLARRFHRRLPEGFTRGFQPCIRVPGGFQASKNNDFRSRHSPGLLHVLWFSLIGLAEVLEILLPSPTSFVRRLYILIFSPAKEPLSRRDGNARP
jgi:hypothetical protein